MSKKKTSRHTASTSRPAAQSTSESAAQPVTARRASLPLPAIIAGVVVVLVVAIAAVLLTRSASAPNANSPNAAAPAQMTRPSEPLPAEVPVSDAKARVDAGAFLLDVREPSEWESFHISGATLIPLGTLSSRLKDVPRDKDIVVMCRSGHRSAQGRDILLQAGFTRVTSMAGGVTAWKAQGLPTVSGQ